MKRFPILNQQNCVAHLRKKMPQSVLWSVVEPLRDQVRRNHDQSLEHLAKRGGLAPEELYAAAHDLRGRAAREVAEQTAIDWLYAISSEP